MATSSTHAEYITTAKASKEQVWTTHCLSYVRGHPSWQSWISTITPLTYSWGTPSTMLWWSTSMCVTTSSGSALLTSLLNLTWLEPMIWLWICSWNCLHVSSTNVSATCWEWRQWLVEGFGHWTVGECWSCSPLSMVGGIPMPGTTFGGVSAGCYHFLAHHFLGSMVHLCFTCSAKYVSFYFYLVSTYLKGQCKCLWSMSPIDILVSILQCWVPTRGSKSQ